MLVNGRDPTLQQQLAALPFYALNDSHLFSLYDCCRAASIYMPLRKQIQTLERSLQEVQVQLELSNGTLEAQASELSRQRKQSSTAQESHRLDLLAAEERGDRLSTRLQVEVARRQEREALAGRCEEALADAEAMRKEVRCTYCRWSK
jgi:hypothetical protein